MMCTLRVFFAGAPRCRPVCNKLTMADNKEKKFVMKHVFTDVSRIPNDTFSRGDIETHFNAPWRLYFKKTNETFKFDLRCLKFPKGSPWTADATIDVKLTSKSGEAEAKVVNTRYSELKSYSEWLVKEAPLAEYEINGNVAVECHVTINKTTGFPESFRSFDDPTEELSDVVLVVKDRKFYVNKKYLATHSPFFKALLLKNFDEFKQVEIELKDIDPSDFQNFLEVLYGEPVIHEDSVKGILKLADMYDAETAIRQCEKFLLNDSKQELEVKFHLAVQYKLEELKKRCMSKIKTIDDIDSVLPESTLNFDPEVLLELLNKSIDIYNRNTHPSRKLRPSMTFEQ